MFANQLTRTNGGDTGVMERKDGNRAFQGKQ